MTTASAIRIVSAGAGAGKTHHIEHSLAEWIVQGLVRPERVVAVTFTEAAASELRQRIRQRLLALGRLQDALALEQAYVTTIHGLGLRLLTEHAFAHGGSPRPRLLGDVERQLLMRQALAHSSALAPIKNDLRRHGYQVHGGSSHSAEEQLRNEVLHIIDLLRSLGDDGRSAELLALALADLAATYGPTVSDAQAAANALADAVRSMLAAFPQGGAGDITTKGPRQRLAANLELFQRVARDPAALESDWALWNELGDLFISTSRSKTPSGYDELAHNIMAAASVLPRHPGPLADASEKLSCLIRCAQQVMDGYEARKKKLGVIDYADMICAAESLLRKQPEVLAAVVGDIDCVIIDEFQDTNPVQFALLSQLIQHAPRSLLVGDIKQSIMGFQGADPRLSQALAEARPEALQVLANNWRSTPALMEFINALGSALFGADYSALQPLRAAVDVPALDILPAPHGRSSRNHSRPQAHVADHIVRLLNNGEPISDPRRKELRPLQPADIAVLVCQHSTAAKYAEELRQRGLPVRIAESGWLESTAVSVGCAALAYAANPDDRHAALLLRTLGPDPLALEAALAAQLDNSLAADPLLLKLAQAGEEVVKAPLPQAVRRLLDCIALPAWADRLDEHGQARADLLRLQAEAEAFVDAHRDLRAAAGFHGDNLKVFLGWLRARSSEREFDRRPDPAADSTAAIEIVTWHAAKGREWPVTVVAELDYDISERPGTSALHFADLDAIDDMERVLASARILHTPRLLAKEAQQRFIDSRRDHFVANARRLLYVALTRARDRIILEWPAFLDKKGTKKAGQEDSAGKCSLYQVLTELSPIRLGADQLELAGVKIPARILTLADLAAGTKYAAGANDELLRPGAPTLLPAAARSPQAWRLVPSELRGTAPNPGSEAIQLGQAWPATASDTSRGTALHLALHALLLRPELAPALPQATCLDEAELERIAERARSLKQWLQERGYTRLHAEVPLSGSYQGSEVHGSIDLLAESADGYLLIDHKTGGSGEGLGHYWPQLSAYIGLMEQVFPAKPLQAVAVFWVDHGQLELVELEAVAEMIV